MEVPFYNSSVIGEKLSYAGEPGNQLEVSTSSFDQLPTELLPIIFAMAKSAVPTFALVNRQWREIADSKVLQDDIFPQSAFGKKDWNRYFPGMAGNETFLPRCAYGDFDQGDLLTFIPEILKMKDEDGNIRDEPVTLALMGELVKNSRSQYKTSLKICDEQAIYDLRTSGPSRWVLIKGKAIGKSMCFVDQEKLVNEQGKGASVAGLIDMVVSIFTKFIKTGEQCIFKDRAVDILFIRLRDKSERRLLCDFGPAGLLDISSFDDRGTEIIGVAVARKSIGT